MVHLYKTIMKWPWCTSKNVCQQRNEKVKGLESFLGQRKWSGVIDLRGIQIILTIKCWSFNCLFIVLRPCFYKHQQLVTKGRCMIHSSSSWASLQEGLLKQKLFKPIFTLLLRLVNQKDNINLGIGFLTHQPIQKLLNGVDLNKSQVDKFYDGVR